MVTKRSLKTQLKKAIGNKLLIDSTQHIAMNDYFEHEILCVAYDTLTNEFISDDKLNNILTTLKSQVNNLDVDINEVSFTINTQLIAYTFKEKALEISTYYIDTIYRTYNGYLKFRPSPIKEYGKPALRVIYYNDLTILSKMSDKGLIPTPFKFDLDFLEDNKSFMLKLKEFQLVKDLKIESKLTQYHYSKDKNFKYNQVLQYKSRNEFLTNEWKTLSKLTPYLNINKFTYDELFMFRKIKPRFTDTEFRRLLNWYHKNKEWYRLNHICLPEQVFEHYIKDKCNYKTCKKNKHNYIYLSADILNMSQRLKTKIEFNATSHNGLKRYHDELAQKLKLRKAKVNKNPFKLKDKWINTHNLLQKSKLKIKHLNSVYLLDKESADMQHCVQIYDEKVKSGTSYIFHIDYYKKPYTCELVIKNKNKKVVINQLYGKYNQQPDPKLKQKLEKLLEKVNAK